MSLTVKHSRITGVAADPTALVDGPAWDDAHALTGILGLDQGGTGSNLTSTGGTGNVLKQSTIGAAVTVGTITPGDITTTSQTITAGASVTVAATDTTIVLNKTVGSATAVSLPSSSSKNGAVLVVDFKGDSDVHAITVSLTGADKFPVNLTTWTISSQGASALFTPIPGVGYAVS